MPTTHQCRCILCDYECKDTAYGRTGLCKPCNVEADTLLEDLNRSRK